MTRIEQKDDFRGDDEEQKGNIPGKISRKTGRSAGMRLVLQGRGFLNSFEN